MFQTYIFNDRRYYSLETGDCWLLTFLRETRNVRRHNKSYAIFKLLGNFWISRLRNTVTALEQFSFLVRYIYPRICNSDSNIRQDGPAQTERAPETEKKGEKRDRKGGRATVDCKFTSMYANFHEKWCREQIIPAASIFSWRWFIVNGQSIRFANFLVARSNVTVSRLFKMFFIGLSPRVE